MKLVECVPNFSEGRARGVTDAIAAAVTSVAGIRLLDVDSGAATNRTVFTFVGPIAAVEEAAFAAMEKAAALIDMRAHKGEHPRIGATDVCPFVPLGDTTMEECVELARRVGRRAGEQLGIPVYLYEEAATSPARRSLAEIRKGEYEGLEKKLKDPSWTPDFGPARFNARSGASVVGAREFLIAYNVDLNTKDRKLANLIAQEIRETGRPKRGSEGKILKDAGGSTITEPGRSLLACVRATGWYIEEYGQAQVSINLTNFKVTPPHKVFEAVEQEAAKLGLRVTGSEIIGLVPLEAIRMAGRHYLAKQGKSPSAPEPELVRAAIVSLGLEDVAAFDPGKKIIERCVEEPRRLARMSLEDLAHAVSAAVPAPGGGSVAAICGALSAGLSAMVSALSYERKGTEGRREAFARLGGEAQSLKSRLLDAVDADADAFDRLIEANRLPRGNDDERRTREDAVRAATLGAIEVPLSVMRDSVKALELAGEMARDGLASALSDAGVAALAAGAAAEGAYYNVRINLPGLDDQAASARLRSESEGLLHRAAELKESVTTALRQSLENP
jgi:glutamate formiminotransferase/formiminotetrahydrofolate cyclodeaminase